MRRSIGSGLSRFVASLMVALLTLTSLAAVAGTAATSATATVFDDETVYVVMDSTGEPQSTVVIDWLRFDADGQVTITDVGDVTSAAAVKENVEPVIQDDQIAWTLEAEGRRDFFYRATTEQELPLEVEVTYTLDGREVSPAEVAGASGHLRIDVDLTNNLAITEDIAYVDADGVEQVEEVEYWMPLLAPVMIDVDGTRFSNIEGEAEIVSVTGSTVSHTFMAFPQPDATVSIEMDGVDIEIEPIIVSVFPKMAGSPDFSTVDQLAEMREGTDGLAMLSEGHYAAITGIADGLDPAAYEGIGDQLGQFDELLGGVTQLREGTDGLAQLVDGQIAYLDGVISGIDSQDLDPIAGLPSALASMTAGVESAKAGIDGVTQLLGGQMLFLDQLAASNTGLEITAWAHATSSGDATATTIATGLTSQTMMINALRYGDDNLGLPYGLDYTHAQLTALAVGLGDIASGLAFITEESRALETLPAEMTQLAGSLRVLRDGGTVQGQTLPGLKDTKSGIEGISAGLAAMEEGVASSSQGLAQLSEIPEAFASVRTALLTVADGGEIQGQTLPGISTTVEGLDAMSSGIALGVSEGHLGEAIVKHMEKAAAEYDTFLGKPEGATGDVRFVFKLDGVLKDE